MTGGDGRDEWRRHALVTTARHGQTFLPARTAINERSQKGEVVGEIFEHALEVSLKTGYPRPPLLTAPVTPLGKLA